MANEGFLYDNGIATSRRNIAAKSAFEVVVYDGSYQRLGEKCKELVKNGTIPVVEIPGDDDDEPNQFYYLEEYYLYDEYGCIFLFRNTTPTSPAKLVFNILTVQFVVGDRAWEGRIDHATVTVEESEPNN